MKPIFIFGCERSGTTLLGSLLGSNSRCVATPESHFTYEVFRSSHVNKPAVDLAEAAAAIQRNFRFRLWNVDADLEAARAAGVSTYPELMRYLVRAYASGVGRSSADIWIDHTPSNVRSAATLADLFPDAQFVHIVRDGRAVVASIKSLAWGYHATFTLSTQWVQKVGLGLAAEAYLGPQRCLRVHYEQLVADPEAVLRGLCAFAGLDYEPEMLTGAGFAVPSYTVTQHALVGRPADPTRVNAWEQQLSETEIASTEYYTGDLLRYLGYTPKYGVRAQPESTSARYTSYLLDICWYRPRDAWKERRKRRRSVARLAAEGYRNRRPS